MPDFVRIFCQLISQNSRCMRHSERLFCKYIVTSLVVITIFYINNGDFADAPHSESAKSAALICLSYGIFSSKFLPVKSNKEHASIPGNTLLSILYAFYNSFIFLLRTYNLARNRTAGCCLWRSQIDLYLGCSHTAQEVAVIGCNYSFTIC